MDNLESTAAAALIIGYIARVLQGAFLPYLTQKTAPAIIARIKEKRETIALSTPELLRDHIANGSVKTGQFVEGNAFFTPFTDSHKPIAPIQPRINDVVSAMFQMFQQQAQDPKNPYVYVLPTTKFPIVNDDYRVGFLYPETMSGFGIPLFHDGTVKTLPFMGRLICILKAADLMPVENCIVKYRGRVLTVPKSDFLAVFPGLTDDLYEEMVRDGRLNFLSLIEDGTYIEFFCNTPQEVIIGSHFIETHWEIDQLGRGKDFGVELNAAIIEACRKEDIPPPQYYSEQVNNLNVWTGSNYSFTQPRGVPYFNFQVHTNLNPSDVAVYNKSKFDAIAKAVIGQMQDVYNAGGTPKDVDAVNDFKSPCFTILQSTAARSIEDPVYKSVIRWLEQRIPTQQDEKNSSS